MRRCDYDIIMLTLFKRGCSCCLLILIHTNFFYKTHHTELKTKVHTPSSPSQAAPTWAPSPPSPPVPCLPSPPHAPP